MVIKKKNERISSRATLKATSVKFRLTFLTLPTYTLPVKISVNFVDLYLEI